MARNPHASYEASDHQRMPIIPKFTDYIANNLTTTVAGFALDARQGKILNETKLNIANVVNNLTTTVAGYALDARQGKALDDKITSLNNSLNWNLVSAYNTTVIGASGIVDTTIANTYRSVSVEYGMTNGNQSYAGSTLFSPWRDGISKPCYVPYYNGNSCNAIVYIFFNYYGGHVSTFIHSNSSGGNLSIRFKIWAR